MSSRRYCIVTPCRDEAKYARRTLDSVTRQSEPPALWVIVDDGSKDATPHVLAEYAAKFPWIRVEFPSFDELRTNGLQGQC